MTRSHSASATLIGFTAILMWSLLAVLTAASGTVPPFQLAAMTFLIGGGLGAATWPFRRGAASCAPAAGGGVDARRRRPVRLSRALFHGAATRAAGGSRPAQLFLAAADRAVLGAAAGRAAENPPCRRRADRPCRHRGAVRRPGLALAGDFLPGYAAAFVAAFVWATYSVLSRRFASVPTDAVAGFCLATAALAAIFHVVFERTVWPANAVQWLVRGRARHRSGGRGVLCLGLRRQARRHPGAGAASSNAAPVLSTMFLVAGRLCGGRAPTLALSAALIAGGGLLAAKDMIGATANLVTPPAWRSCDGAPA